MTSPAAGTVRAGRDRGGVAYVGLAAGLSAAVGYAVTVLAARLLGSVAETTRLLTFVSLVMVWYGVLAGVSLETTRAHASVARTGASGGTRTWRVAAALMAGCLLAVVLAAPLWRRLLDAPSDALLALLAGGVAAYVGHACLVGAVSGRRRWRLAAGVVAVEAATRALVLVAVCVVGVTVPGLALVTVAGAAGWVLVLVASPTARAALAGRFDHGPLPVTGRVLSAMGAQAAGAALVVGFPALLSATTSRHEYLTAAPLILAVTLTRAPLLVPLNAFQGMLVSTLTHRSGRLAVPALTLPAGLGALAVLLLGAWTVGPVLMVAVLGPSYDVSGAVLAALVVAAVLLAALSVSGAVCQTRDRPGAYLAGWLVALAGTVAVLLAPGGLTGRAVLALLVGPAAGVLVHVVAARRTAVDRAAT